MIDPQTYVREPNATKLAYSLAFGVFLIYLSFMPPGIYSYDGGGTLAVAESIINHHDITVPQALGIPGRGGQYYSIGYPLQSLISVPFVALGYGLANSLHIPAHYTAALIVSILPCIFIAGSTGFVCLIAHRLGSTLSGARRAGLCFALGTIAIVYARTFFTEPLMSLLVISAAFCAVSGSRRHVIWAGALSALAVLEKPTGILLGPTLSLYLLMKRKEISLAFLPAVGAISGLILFLPYNYARFGGLLTFGPNVAVSVSSESDQLALSLNMIPRGFAGLLFSPGRGLIWYSPAALVAMLGIREVRRPQKLDALLLLALFIGWLGLHSMWSTWHGGGAWGPRYLFPVLPCVMALGGLLRRRLSRAFVMLSVIGFAISAPTLISYYERYYTEAHEARITNEQIYWSVPHAPLLRIWTSAANTVRDARNHDVRDVFSQPHENTAKTLESSRIFHVLAVWWWITPVGHVPRIVGFLIALGLTACGGWILYRSQAIARLSGSKPSPNE